MRTCETIPGDDPRNEAAGDPFTILDRYVTLIDYCVPLDVALRVCIGTTSENRDKRLENQ
jgi:hypothetical protein